MSGRLACHSRRPRSQWLLAASPSHLAVAGVIRYAAGVATDTPNNPFEPPATQLITGGGARTGIGGKVFAALLALWVAIATSALLQPPDAASSLAMDTSNWIMVGCWSCAAYGFWRGSKARWLALLTPLVLWVSVNVVKLVVVLIIEGPRPYG